jgi:O-antigen ligase
VTDNNYFRDQRANPVATGDAPLSHVVIHAQESSAGEKGTLLVMLYTLLVFLRPHELIAPLGPLRLPLVFLILSAGYVLLRSGQSLGQALMETETRLLLVLLGILCISATTGLWMGNSFVAIKTVVLPVFVLYLCLVSLIKSMNAIVKLSWIIVLGISINLTISLFDYFHGENLTMGRLYGRAVGLYGNPNDLAVTGVMAMPFIFWLLNICNTRLKKVLLLVILVLDFIVILFTYSRTGILAIGFLLFALIVRSKNKLRSFVLMLVLLLGIAVYAPERFFDRVASIGNAERDESGARAQRLALATKGIVFFFKNPIMGIGLGNFTIAEGKTHEEGHWKVAHNGFIELAVEAGFFGFIIFAVLLVKIATNLRDARKRFSNTEPEYKNWFSLCGYLQIAFGVLLLCMLFGVSPYNWFLYYILTFSIVCRRVSMQLADTSSVS